MGGFAEYESYDAVGLADLVRRAETTPEELLDAAIERAEARNPRLNAIVSPMYDEARARLAEGLPKGPLHGVPFLLKDLHALYEGVPTSNGAALFKDAVADHDSELVARYKRAGLSIFGKTNTPELGLSPSTEPRLFGPTHNPWNPAHTAGGSSGGAAAAVAARILPVAHASDGGGSIRIPASCCGLFGLKPTRGRNPQGPDVGEGWAGMSAQHVVSLTVRDSAALLDATHGPALGDPYAAPPPARPFLEEVGAAPGRLRIALALAAPSGIQPDPECERAVRQAAALCEQLGHSVSEEIPAVDAELLRRSTPVIIGANTRSVLLGRAQQLGRELVEDDVEKMTWILNQMGASASATDYAEAVKAIHSTGRRMGEFFERYDVLLTPMLSTPPVELGILDMMTDDMPAYLEALGAFTGYSQLLNATGQPAMSMPLHWTGGDLPVGVHFAGRFGDEATLFRLAAQIEQAQPWIKRRPALAS